MSKFHVNPATGVASACRATKGGCPFGGDEAHYPSVVAARAAYEASQGQALAAPLTRTASQSNPAAQLAEVEARLGHARGEEVWVRNEIGYAQERVRSAEQEYAEHLARVQNPQTPFDRDQGPALLDQADRALARYKAQEQGLRHRQATLLTEIAAEEAMESMLRTTVTNREAKALLEGKPRTFNADRVAALARSATAANYGSTVVSVEQDGEAVLLRMSSWPRAKEAEKFFKEKGWVTEYTGDAHGGELIRVLDPATSSRIFKNSAELTWVPESQTYVMDASDFGEFPSEGFTFISQRDGSAVRVLPAEEVRDAENEITEWRFRPENSIHGWTVSVFND